jgi:hypothetical protein
VGIFAENFQISVRQFKNSRKIPQNQSTSLFLVFFSANFDIVLEKKRQKSSKTTQNNPLIRRSTN